jgi:hypothetical protein
MFYKVVLGIQNQKTGRGRRREYKIFYEKADDKIPSTIHRSILVILLKLVLQDYQARLWTGLNSSRTESRGGFMYTRERNFRFHKR